MHEPNADVLEATLWKQVTPDPNTGMAATLLAATTLYLFVERPFMALRGTTHTAPVAELDLPTANEASLSARVT